MYQIVLKFKIYIFNTNGFNLRQVFYWINIYYIIVKIVVFITLHMFKNNFMTKNIIAISKRILFVKSIICIMLKNN